MSLSSRNSIAWLAKRICHFFLGLHALCSPCWNRGNAWESAERMLWMNCNPALGKEYDIPGLQTNPGSRLPFPSITCEMCQTVTPTVYIPGPHPKDTWDGPLNTADTILLWLKQNIQAGDPWENPEVPHWATASEGAQEGASRTPADAQAPTPGLFSEYCFLNYSILYSLSIYTVPDTFLKECHSPGRWRIFQTQNRNTRGLPSDSKWLTIFSCSRYSLSSDNLTQFNSFKYHPYAENTPIYITSPDSPPPELQTHISNCLHLHWDAS